MDYEPTFTFDLVLYEYWDDPAWVCRVDTMKAAMDVAHVKARRFGEDYYEVKREKATWDRPKHGHISSRPAKMMEDLLVYHQDSPLNTEQEQTALNELAFVSQVFIEPIIETVAEGEKWYVNKNWGMIPYKDDEFTVRTTCERNEYVFPVEGEDDIEIMQWPNGRHYYAKVGNQQVRIDGEQKWVTFRRAYDRALEFLGKVLSEQKHIEHDD